MKGGRFRADHSETVICVNWSEEALEGIQTRLGYLERGAPLLLQNKTNAFPPSMKIQDHQTSMSLQNLVSIPEAVFLTLACVASSWCGLLER